MESDSQSRLCGKCATFRRTCRLMYGLDSHQNLLGQVFRPAARVLGGSFRPRTVWRLSRAVLSGGNKSGRKRSQHAEGAEIGSMTILRGVSSASSKLVRVKASLTYPFLGGAAL